MNTPIPARLNVALVLGYAASSLGLLVVASRTWPPQFAGSIVPFVLAMAGFSLIFNTGFGLVHEAEHFALHPHRRVNEGLGWLLGALFPGSFSLLRSAHLVHHGSNRNDRELIEYVKPGESKNLKTLHYYLCLFGVFWVGTPALSLALCAVPGRAFGPRGEEPSSGSAAGFLAFLEDLSPQRVRMEGAAVVVFWGLAAWALQLSLAPTLAMYALAGCFWSSQQFIYHVGTPRHLVEGTRNGKEVTYTTTEAGEKACARYREIREQCLTSNISPSGEENAEIGELARLLRVLTGLYEQAARSATSL